MKDAADSVEARRRDDDSDEVARVVDPSRVRASVQPQAQASSGPGGGGGGGGEDLAGAAQSLNSAQRELEAALEKARQDTSDLKDKWLRAAADLENYRKRSARERDDAVKFGNEKLLRELLPVLDDIDRTVEVAQQQAGAGGNQAVSTLIEGLKLVQKKFLTQLEKNGVESFSAVGQAFDPALHEAVQQVHSQDVPAGAVAQEIRRGFNLSGRLLRPALVAVSLGPKSE